MSRCYECENPFWPMFRPREFIINEETEEYAEKFICPHCGFGFIVVSGITKVSDGQHIFEMKKIMSMTEVYTGEDACCNC